MHFPIYSWSRIFFVIVFDIVIGDPLEGYRTHYRVSEANKITVLIPYAK